MKYLFYTLAFFVLFDVSHFFIDFTYTELMFKDVDFIQADGHQYAIDKQMESLHPTLTHVKKWFDHPNFGIYTKTHQLLFPILEKTLRDINKERYGRD